MTTTQSTAQDSLNFNLVNDQQIDLNLVAKNPHLPWNPVILSLNTKLTKKFVDDHPELPWDENILSGRFSRPEPYRRTQLTSSIDNKPDIPLIELSTHKFNYGQLIITVTFHVVSSNQGVILAQFDNEFYYFCQLDIDGKNPQSIADDKRTLELSQLDQIHVDYMTEKLTEKLDNELFRSAWDDTYQPNMRLIIREIKKNGNNMNQYHKNDLRAHKRYVLSKLESMPDSIHLEIVRWLCQSKYTTNVHRAINCILKLMIKPSRRIYPIDLSYALLAVITFDYSIEERLALIAQFVKLTNVEGYDDPTSCSIAILIKEMLDIDDLELSHRYRIIKLIVKTNCSAIIKDHQYD